MNIAPLRAASSTGLVLIALSAFSPLAGATVRANAGGTSGASASDVQCPCNAGLPDRASAALATPALRATSGDAVRSGGGQFAGSIGVAPSPASQPSGTFDWADASVGAGLTTVIGLLVAAGAMLFGRRGVREQVGAS